MTDSSDVAASSSNILFISSSCRNILFTFKNGNDCTPISLLVMCGMIFITPVKEGLDPVALIANV